MALDFYAKLVLAIGFILFAPELVSLAGFLATFLALFFVSGLYEGSVTSIPFLPPFNFFEVFSGSGPPLLESAEGSVSSVRVRVSLPDVVGLEFVAVTEGFVLRSRGSFCVS